MKKTKMTEEEYWKEDLRLKRIEIIVNSILTLGIILFASFTFLKQYPDFFSNFIGVMAIIFIIILLWKSLKTIPPFKS